MIISRGHKYTLVLVSLTKKALQSEMPASMRLEFLQHLDNLTDTVLTPTVIADVEPMCDQAYEIVQEAQKCAERSLDIFADKFEVFAALNPSILAAVKAANCQSGKTDDGLLSYYSQ